MARLQRARKIKKKKEKKAVSCCSIRTCLLGVLVILSVLLIFNSHNYDFSSKRNGNSSGREENVDENQQVRESSLVNLPPCQPIDIEETKDTIQCTEKCKFETVNYPGSNYNNSSNNIDFDEQVVISVGQGPGRGTVRAAYGKYQVHFPEENIHLNAGAVVRQASQDIRPRSITERLFRRIIAKLFRAGILNPAGNIVNTGSWIGDNAVPWALMLEQIHPQSPGTIYAIDPSPNNVQFMIEMAQANNVSNLCTQITVFSSENKIMYNLGNIDHTSFSSTRRRKSVHTQAIKMDILDLQNVVLLHIDVEGHEAELLEGARELLASSRPVVVTEATAGWPPTNDAEKRVMGILQSLGYHWTNEIPEICGWLANCRNRIWWPDAKTKSAAMAVIGKDLARPLVSWMSAELPEV